MDVTNQENIPPQHEVREASWKDDEEYWDNLYPESSAGDDEDPTHELSYEVANDCVSYAEHALVDVGPCIDLLETEYQMCPIDIPQDYLEIFGTIVPVLLQRTEVALRLSILVDKYCSDYIMRGRTEVVRVNVEVYQDSLVAFMDSVARDVYLSRQRDLGPQELVPAHRNAEGTPRAHNDHVIAAPLANQTRRALNQPRHSSDLQRSREGRGHQNGNHGQR